MSYASISIGGRKIERWESYRIASSILVPADEFSLQMKAPESFEDLRELQFVLGGGADVKVYILTPGGGRHLQHTGVLEQPHTKGSRTEGVQLAVHGRDLACHLTDSSVPIAKAKEVGTNFVDLVRELVAPRDIQVSLDATASRHIASGQASTTHSGRLVRQRARRLGVPFSSLSNGLVERAGRRRQPMDEITGLSPRAARIAADRSRRGAANGLTASDIERVRLSDARPQAGETVWAFLERHAERFGLMIWFDPRGRLVISSPDYSTEPSHRLVRRLRPDPSDPNNIESGDRTQNYGDRYSECTVYGRTHGRDATRARVSAKATDESMPFYRPLVVHDNGARTEEECLRVAKRSLAEHTQDADIGNAQVTGHGGETLFAIDSVIEVHDEVTGVFDNRYCVARTFTCSRSDGPMTDIEHRPLGCIQL